MLDAANKIVSIAFLNVGLFGIFLSFLLLGGNLKKIFDDVYFSALHALESGASAKKQALTGAVSFLELVYVKHGRLSKKNVLIVSLLANAVLTFGLFTLRLDESGTMLEGAAGEGESLKFLLLVIPVMIASNFVTEYVSAAMTLYFARKAAMRERSIYFFLDAVALVAWLVVPPIIIVTLVQTPQFSDTVLNGPIGVLGMAAAIPIYQAVIFVFAVMHSGAEALLILPSVLSVCFPTIGCYCLYRVFGGRNSLVWIVRAVEVVDKEGWWKILTASGTLVGIGASLFAFKQA